MTDRIHLFGVRLHCRLGVPAEERRNPQEIELDVMLEGDWRAAALSESIADTVDYSVVRDLLEEVAASREWVLIESLAEAMCRQVLDCFAVDAVHILLKKPQALAHVGVAAAAVEIERRRNG